MSGGLHWPHMGAVLSRLGRGRGALPPFVSMRPKLRKRRAAVRRGEPRPVRRLAGPVFDPLTIDADPSRADYRVGDFDAAGGARRVAARRAASAAGR